MNKLVNNIPNDLDARDQEILAEIFERRAAFTIPCMGDYVVFPGGQLERFSSDYSDRIQTSPSGSFYLTSSGFGSLGSDELLHPMRCKGWSFTGRMTPRLGQFLTGY